MEALAGHAALIQTAALLLGYVAAALWELRRPIHPYGPDDTRRLVGNFGLLCVNHGLPYLIVPLAAGLSAWGAATLDLGLLRALDLPLAALALIGLLAYDLTGWVVHWALHRSAWLWRIHRVHHSDLRFDSALGFRFHPGEVLLMAAAHGAVVLLLGLPVVVVLLAGVLTTLHNFFGHANARPGERTEHALRRAIITPDLHRVHHSADPDDANHNYGIVLSWWDRLAGTYRAPVGEGPAAFGLDTDRDPARLSLVRLLLMPFRRPA